MPALSVTYVNGSYELVVDNVGTIGLVDTEQVVQLLAESMAEGVQAVVANSEFIFEAGQLTAEGVESIFEGVDTLYLGAELVFDATEAGSLLAALVEAGEALLAALA